MDSENPQIPTTKASVTITWWAEYLLAFASSKFLVHPSLQSLRRAKISSHMTVTGTKEGILVASWRVNVGLVRPWHCCSRIFRLELSPGSTLRWSRTRWALPHQFPHIICSASQLATFVKIETLPDVGGSNHRKRPGRNNCRPDLDYN